MGRLSRCKCLPVVPRKYGKRSIPRLLVWCLIIACCLRFPSISRSRQQSKKHPRTQASLVGIMHGALKEVALCGCEGVQQCTAHKPIIMRSHNLLCTVFILLKNTACRPPHLGLCHAASKAALTRPRRSSSRTRAERSILKGGDVLTNAISVMLGPKGDLRKNCARK